MRGSKLPVNVQNFFTASQVLDAALNKRADFDQFFCELENYFLMYPEQKRVDKVPGSNDMFTVSKYKKWLGKPFSRIDLSK